jgi:hypothetical protein
MSTTISSSTTGPVVLGTADNPLYITSTGTVTSTGSVDGIDGGAGTTWTITNAGVVSAASGNGVSLAGSGIVGNTGSISGMDALVLKAGGSVTNNVGGSISGLGALGAGLGSGAGVDISGAAGTVTNNSTISGVAYGVGFGAGGLVTNTSSITGGEDGVIIQGAIGTVSNSGSITATVDDGVALFAGGSVTNASGASISGLGTLGAGIFITGGVGTVTNAGSISGPNHHGVLIAGGGSLSNAATGSISALGVGVFFETNPGTITNAGFITGTGVDGTGIYLENGGNATNTSTGTITGNKFGAFLEGGSNTLANYGSISGATYDGVVLGHGGTVTNAAGASISGLNGGVYVKYRAAGTVTNSGSISASGTGSAGIDLADGGSVTNNSTGSISGNSFGVFMTGAAGTVTNTGSIASANYGGVELVKGGSVTNSAGASIKGGSAGVYIGTGASGTVTNSGSINAASASGAGVALGGGGNITNNSGGSISGGAFGVFTTGTLGTLSNSGSISGAHGVGLEAGGSVTNTASGTISGQSAGVFVTGGAATLSNAGNISATAGSGADIEGGGSITNLAGATISGSTFGVFLTGGSGTVTNTGSISGATDAIDLAGGGSITNNSGGSISGSHGISLAAGGSVTNAASASILGQVDGVFAQGGAATLSNAGSISATAGTGADIEGGGSVTNLAGATISGSTFGIFLTGGSGTVTNAGTISGGTYAIDFAGSGTNRLVVDPGAVFVGGVTGGSGTSTLELASGTGSIGGVGTGSFNHFQVLAVDAGASWTLNGANIAPTVLDDGTVNIAGSLDVSTAVDPNSTGLFQLGSGATLEVAADTGTATPVNFQGGSSELIIDNAALFGTNVGTASYAGPQLQAFAPGDKIDLKNFSSAGVTLSYNASTGLLQVSNSANQVASLDFQTSSLASSSFAAASDGAGGIFITDPPIEASGSTELVEVGNNYFLDSISSGTGPELKFSGGPVTVGQAGAYSPIGAEQTATGYEVAWKAAGADSYTVWATDSNGNYISNLIMPESGSSLSLETIETSFHQDLNGDGTIGPVSTVIEAFGVTSLVQVGNNYYLESGGTGPALKFSGAPVTVGQAGAYSPIGAEQTATGYEVAWKEAGVDSYSVWATDSNGNYISNLITPESGSSLSLQTIETSFHQDLNGDGTIGPVSTVIEAFGSTSLVQVGNNYYLESGGTGPALKYSGGPVTVGLAGAYSPIGAEQTATGYEVAWKEAGVDSYSVWATDSNGNYISNLIMPESGSSLSLQTIETSFHQDLNGDGTIGPVPIVIESLGTTSLVQVGNNYYLESGGTGPALKYSGAPVTVGQAGAWSPIGAEQTATGYVVAWKEAGADQYTEWATDSNGNYISNLINPEPGNSLSLETAETVFHQDLNGDGTIGPVVIEASGSTTLIQASNEFFLGNGSGPSLKYGGIPVVVGQAGAWEPIGAQQTATGYVVAWKEAGADQYTEWATDSNGNYISNLINPEPGASASLETAETVFYQDLNGDGVIDTPSTIIEATGNVRVTLSHLTQAATIDAGSTLELTGADSGSVTFSGATGALVLDHSSTFSGQIFNFTGNGSVSGSDQIDLKDIAFGAGTTVAYTGTSAGGTLTVSDAQSHTASISLAGNYTGSTFTLSSDGAGGTVVIDPPACQTGSGPPSSANGSSIHGIMITDFAPLDRAPPSTPAPPPYATLAGLLDQYLAAGPHHPSGVSQTSWTGSQQAWLGGDKEFLTRPQS